MSDRFYIEKKPYYSGNWLFLLFLFIAAILAWWQISPLVAAILAAAGFIIMLINNIKGKKRAEEHFLEILDKCIIFNEGSQSASIAFADIKKVKYSDGISSDFPTITIETGIGKKIIQLSDYADSNKLLKQLENKFALFNLR